MSSSSDRDPVAPVESKDMRTPNLEFKYAKEHRIKWANGVRPLPGARLPLGEEDFEGMKVRPNRTRNTEPKSHANKNPRLYGHYDLSRLVNKVDAMMESNDDSSYLSKSLLELLPQHANNTNSAIQVAIRESAAAADGEILYSFDNKGPSPSDKGRKVDLGGLVDQAEKRYLNKQTDRLVKVEYEVLDNDGETTVLYKNKGKRSPKQKATKIASPVTQSSATEVSTLDNDGFEMVEPLPK